MYVDANGIYPLLCGENTGHHMYIGTTNAGYPAEKFPQYPQISSGGKNILLKYKSIEWDYPFFVLLAPFLIFLASS